MLTAPPAPDRAKYVDQQGNMSATQKQEYEKVTGEYLTWQQASVGQINTVAANIK